MIQNVHQNAGGEVVRTKKLLGISLHCDLPIVVLGEILSDSLQKLTFPHACGALNDEELALTFIEFLKGCGHMFEVKFSAGYFCLLKLMQGCLVKDLLRREIAGAGQLITSCLFGTVESGISRANEIFAGLSIVRSRSESYAQSDGNFALCILEHYGFGVDQLQEFFAHVQGPLLVNPGQEYHEFITRIADGMPAVSGRLSE